MVKYNFNDRPDATRITGSIKTAGADIDPELVLQFLNFQWTYRSMQRQYDAVLANSDLSESRFIILMFLYQAPHMSLLPSEIADQLGTTRVTVSKLLRGLTSQNWVAKEPSTTDKRATVIHLTSTGQAALMTFLPKNFEAVQILFGQLSPSELSTLSKLLTKINEGTNTLKQEMEN